jgi:hypothetical protein
MTLGIILDDERYYEQITWVALPENYYIVRNPVDFIFQVRLPFIIPWVSFDHDLGWFNKEGREVKGYQCIKWPCRHLDRNPSKPIPKVYFHSKNPIGVDDMRFYWNNWLKTQPEERVRL